MVDVAALWAELEQTTVGYKNLNVKPPTDKQSRWYKARTILGLNSPGSEGGAGLTWVSLDSGGASGDGTTDDTQKAQAVLSAASAGSVIVVPANRTFLVSGLSVPAGVTLLFESQTARVKSKAGSVLPALTLAAGAKCVGGYVDGNHGAVSSSQARGILLAGDGARIEGTEVANVYSYGIQVTDADDAFVDAYVHDTRDIGIFVMSDTRNCKRLKIRGKVDRVGEGTGIVGGGVQVYGETFKYSNIDIDCNVLLPASPADPNACCIIVNGRRGALVKGSTEGGQMGVTFDGISEARTSAYVVGASLYGVEFSNAGDFVADSPIVDCNGLTAGAGIIANRGSSGVIDGPVVKYPAAGAPCVSVHTSSDTAVSSPKLSANKQLAFVAFFDSSRCQLVGGTLKDESGLCNGLLVYSQAQDASDNSATGVTMKGLGTALKVLGHTAGKHADRTMVTALTVVGAETGAFLQAANGGTVAGTRLEQSNLTGVAQKVQSSGATGTSKATTWA